MGFVMVRAGRGLAFVVPDGCGGTELVYLTGEPHKSVALSLYDPSDDLHVGRGEAAEGVARVDRERSADPADRSI